MEENDCPVACALSASEFQTRRSEILQKIVPAVIETKELPNGFAYRFPAEDKWRLELTQFVVFERECCPFLNFRLLAEAGRAAIWLELTGQNGTKEFIASLFSEPKPGNC